jgi:hypothetical protein
MGVRISEGGKGRERKSGIIKRRIWSGREQSENARLQMFQKLMKNLKINMGR